jgi:hypothetical protein
MEVINKFADTPDPHLEDRFLLELYEPNISPSLKCVIGSSLLKTYIYRNCFGEGESPILAQKCCPTLAKFLLWHLDHTEEPENNVFVTRHMELLTKRFATRKYWSVLMQFSLESFKSDSGSSVAQNANMHLHLSVLASLAELYTRYPESNIRFKIIWEHIEKYSFFGRTIVA